MKRDCLICGTEFSFCKSRENTAKFCSRECSGKGATKPRNTRCCVCGVLISKKPSEVSKSKLGLTCSYDCSGTLRKTYYKGDKNPNYKGSGVDSDGYILTPPASPAGSVETRLHREVWRRVCNVDKIPRGIQVHHRDCDVTNNDPLNLVALTASDHKWIHKQYGNATLWAMCNGRIDPNEMISWSDNPSRAKRLLTLTSIAQSFYINQFGLTIEEALTASGPVIAEFVVEETA